MKKSIILAALLVCTVGAGAQNYPTGYYKDIYCDGGLSLSHPKRLPSAVALGLSMETLRAVAKSKNNTPMDTLSQNRAFVGYEADVNGILLYPDGSPRFRMIFVNGGSGATHGKSYTEKGRENIRAFVKAGGSYLGQCAGAYIASQGTHKRDSLGNSYNKYYTEYLGVYPGVVTNANLVDTRVCVSIPENSVMLKYSDFGGDFHIDSVYHNGGCFMDYNDLIEGGEILFNYDYPPKKMHGNGAVWCWKENEYTGRVMSSGPHPEFKIEGEQLEMMEAMVSYCLEGNGIPRIKGELKNGEPRRMVKRTEDSDPAFTKIGDKQFHHYTVEVPEGVDTLKVSLTSLPSYKDFDLYLMASYEGPAFFQNSKYKNIKLGVDKTLTIPAPKAGKIYVSVFCDTTVTADESDFYGTVYSGRLDVLNGVPYIIEAKF